MLLGVPQLLAESTDSVSIGKPQTESEIRLNRVWSRVLIAIIAKVQSVFVMYEHSVYGVVVPERSWVPAPRYLLRRDRILRWVRAQPVGVILEIGPGSGALLRDFSKLGWDCVGLDVSADALELSAYVTEPCDRVELYSSAEALNYRKFDLVVACEVLEHIKEDQAIFNEWADHLKPGGCLLLSMPAHMKRWDATDEWAGHFRRYEYEDLIQLAENNDMVVERIECYGFPLALFTTAFRAIYLSKGNRADTNNPGNMQEKTEQSGINRDFEMRHFKLQQSWLGVLTLKFGVWLQNRFVNKSYGNGYLLWARKR